MTPIGELRVAIPTGILVYHLKPATVFITSIIGNYIPALLLLFFLETVSTFLMTKSKFFYKFFTWLFMRTHRKHSKKFELYGEIALVTFIAIPLPMTGAWTGAVAAFLFGIPLRRSVWLILLGIIIAGIIVTIFTLAGVSFLEIIRNV